MAILAVLAAPASGAGRYLGKAFPDFSATDSVTGEEFSLSDLRGKVVVVDFWASWCGPCRRELPTVKRVHDTYKDRGFEIVSISLDRDEARFKKFVRDNGMDWLHVMEGGGWSTRLARQYGVRSIPTMYVIDADGVCVGDRVRGPALVQTVRRAIGDRAEAVVRQAAPEDDRGAYLTLSNQLGGARRQLELITEPLWELIDRLDRLTVLVDRMQPLVTEPQGTSGRRLAYVRNELHAIRHTLFMMGVIGDERTIILPAADSGGEGLSIAGAAISQMRGACAEVAQQIARVGEQISDLQVDVAGRSSGPGDLEARIGAVRDHALALSETWCEPWLDQLDAAEGIIEELRGPLTVLAAGLDSVAVRIDVIEEALAAPADLASLASLGEPFGVVCRDLGAIYTRLGRLDMIGDHPVSLPANPLDGARMPDAAVNAELRAQIEVAVAAVDTARRIIGKHRRELDRLAAETGAIRDELSVRLAEGTDLEELRARFSELARKALASQDRLRGG